MRPVFRRPGGGGGARGAEQQAVDGIDSTSELLLSLSLSLPYYAYPILFSFGPTQRAVGGA